MCVEPTWKVIEKPLMKSINNIWKSLVIMIYKSSVDWCQTCHRGGVEFFSIVDNRFISLGCGILSFLLHVSLIIYNYGCHSFDEPLQTISRKF